MAGAAWALTAARLAGAAPLTVTLGAAVVPTALGLAALPVGRRWRRSFLPLSLLAPLVVAVAPALARLGGQLTTDRRLWAFGCVAVAALGSLALAARAAASVDDQRPTPATDALALLAGGGVGLSISPPLAALAGAVLVELAHQRPRAGRNPRAESAGPHQVLGTALAGAGLLLALSWARGISSPAASELLTGLLAALAAAAMLRGLAPPARWSPLLGALALLGARVLAWKGPGLARMAVLTGTAGAGPLPTSWLRTLPLVVAGLILGGLLGLCWGPRQRSAGAFWAAALAVALSAILDFDSSLWLAALTGFSALLWSLQRAPQAAGVALGAGAVALAILGQAPDPSILVQAAWPLTRTGEAVAIDVESRAQTTMLAADISPVAADSALRVPTDRWDAARGRFERGARPVLIAESDGLISESVGRAAEAERFAGHLAGLFSGANADVLVLGDDLGQVVGAVIDHPVGLVEVATPQPTMIRAIAAVDPDRKAAWLDPRVRLRSLHPDQALRLGPTVQTVVEVGHAPWSDGAHAPITDVHLDAVRSRLPPDGTYVLALHLPWFDAGQPATVARALARQFPFVQAWLPPFGADTLIFVATGARPSASVVLAALDQGGEALADADLDSGADLLSLAVADGPALAAWADALDAPPRLTALAPGQAATHKPLLHLATLAEHLSAPTALWELDDDGLASALDARRQARASFLHLLGEATTGNMEAVFRRARELQAAGGAVGVATLEPLIDPHLADGRRAMALALQEGLASKQWDEALRYATTARMLAPTSPRPLVLLGEIALGRANVTVATEDFEQALELDADHVPALNGLARAARARGDRVKVEDALRKTTTLAPRDWRTWQNLGVFLAEEGRSDEAEESLRQAVRLTDGKELAPHHALAQLMLDTDRPAAALKFAEDALALDETGFGWYLLGSSHYLLGQGDRAEQDFRRAIILSPDLAEARFGVGVVLAEAGKLEQAAEAFRAVLRIRPDDPAARENLRRVEEEIEATAPPAP